MAGIPKSNRSGGPKTMAGKAVASQNSLQTGVYTNLVVLPGEIESEFYQLENQFIQDFSPQDIAEMTMVRELAAVVWKKLRLERLEQSAFLIRLNEPIQNQEFRSVGLTFKDSARWWMDHSHILTKEFVDIHQELGQQSELYSDKKLTVKELKEMQIMHPKLYSNLLVQADRTSLFEDAEPTLAQLDSLVISSVSDDNKGLYDRNHVPEEEKKFVEVAVERALSTAEDVLWVKKNEVKIKEAITAVKEKRLLKLMELEMPRRIKDDLNRIFFRTLAELRKHQQWRQAKNTIDITPKESH